MKAPHSRFVAILLTSLLLKPALSLASLTSGTLVPTPHGMQAIENLKVGDTVLTYDENSAKINSQEITFLYTRIADDTVRLKVATPNGQTTSIHTTSEHPFYTQQNSTTTDMPYQWIPAKHLKIGDLLRTKNQESVRIIEIENTLPAQRVFNITVAKQHNYFVSEQGVLAHNLDPTTTIAIAATSVGAPVVIGATALGTWAALKYNKRNKLRTIAHLTQAQALNPLDPSNIRNFTNLKPIQIQPTNQKNLAHITMAEAQETLNAMGSIGRINRISDYLNSYPQPNLEYITIANDLPENTFDLMQELKNLEDPYKVFMPSQNTDHMSSTHSTAPSSSILSELDNVHKHKEIFHARERGTLDPEIGDRKISAYSELTQKGRPPRCL